MPPASPAFSQRDRERAAANPVGVRLGVAIALPGTPPAQQLHAVPPPLYTPKVERTAGGPLIAMRIDAGDCVHTLLMRWP